MIAADAPADRIAVQVGSESLTYAALRNAAGAVARAVEGAPRVAVESVPDVRTVVAMVGAMAAGAAVVPLNPKSGDRERAHIAGDSRPAMWLTPADVDLEAVAPLPHRPGARTTALVIYTSGTTGLPKGVVLSHGAVAANLAAVAEAWSWTAADRVVHALPLFHVHGLVLGMLGALRLGGTAHHVGAFTPGAIAAAGGTMVFGVPTMWSRIAVAAESDAAVAAGVGGARLLVSGSAALPLTVHERLERVLGRRVIERYGMTETLFQTAERCGTSAPPGSVGPPLRGVEVRLVDDDGAPTTDPEALGEVHVRGASLFDGYLNLPEATAAAFTDDGWFRTGDIAARRPDGAYRIVGRRATDLIKSGGYRIGAGEIETVLLDHPGVREAAVTGEPDDDLGERIVAWVVCDPHVTAGELIDHVAGQLTPHKRPRDVRFLAELPRNDMGKVLKGELPRASPEAETRP